MRYTPVVRRRCRLLCTAPTAIGRAAVGRGSLLSLALLLTPAPTLQAADMPDGLLDQPLVIEVDGNSLIPAVASETVVEAVQEEQAELESLPVGELQPRAEAGERAAQVALGVDFAREAGNLGVSPAAANAALADAVRWYSLAATPGFPNAPALDRSGVQYFPIRVQR